MQKLFWSLYATVYDAIWDSPVTEHLARAAGAWYPDGAEVVDLGCGTGLMTRDRHGPTVGVDRSGSMLRRAMGRRRITQGVQRPVEDTGLATGSADAVLLCNVLHLHPDPPAVMREAIRLCRPGGSVVISWPAPHLTHAQVRSVERSLGRSLRARWTADLLRRSVGIGAAMLGVRPRQSAEIDALVHGFARGQPAGAVREDTIVDLQRLVTVRALGATLADLSVDRSDPAPPRG